MLKALPFLLLAALNGVHAVAASPKTIQPSADFAVTTNGEESFVYLGTVPGPTGNGRMNVSFVHIVLPATGSVVDVEVSVLAANSSSPVKTAALRPRGSPAVRQNGASSMSFSISNIGHYILELDGEFNVETLSTGLMVFVSLADLPPSSSDSSVVYFDSGIHKIPGETLELQNDSTVYLAHGAVVLGRIHGANVRNVTVRGPGILASEWLPGEPIPASASGCGHCGCPGTNAVLITDATGVLLAGLVADLLFLCVCCMFVDYFQQFFPTNFKQNRLSLCNTDHHARVKLDGEVRAGV